MCSIRRGGEKGLTYRRAGIKLQASLRVVYPVLTSFPYELILLCLTLTTGQITHLDKGNYLGISSHQGALPSASLGGSAHDSSF